MARDHAPAASADAVRWAPVAYSTPNGDRVEAWRTTPPKGFAERLEDDLDGLWREVAERTAAMNGALIEAERVTVHGRRAFRRIERIPPDGYPGTEYAATLLVLLDDDIGLEITVTCSEPDGRPAPAPPAALLRARRLIETLTTALRVRE